MPCPHCHAALTDWTYGGTNAGCQGCTVRETARAPKKRRQDEYARVRRLHGQAAASALLHAAVIEAARIADLRIAALATT